MRCRVIARQRSHVRTIAFILSGKLIIEPLNIYFELRCNDISCSRSVILSVMTRPGVCASVRQLLLHTQLLRHKSPILIEPLEFSDEIRQQISVCIDKPVQLVSVRGRMHACGAAVMDPIDKLFEVHLVPKPYCFRALIQRYNPVPWIANKSELEIGFELPAPGFSPALFRHQQIECGHEPVPSSAIISPGRFHQLLDLPQIQVRLPCLTENGPDACRASLRHLDEDASMFV